MLPPIAGKGIPGNAAAGGGEPFGTGPDGAIFAAGTAFAIGAPAANADAGVNHCPPTLILLRRPILTSGSQRKRGKQIHIGDPEKDNNKG